MLFPPGQSTVVGVGLIDDPTVLNLASPPCSALDKVQPRAVSYEEQVTLLREQLSELYVLQEEWSKAAHALAGIDLDSGGMLAATASSVGQLEGMI